MIYNKKLKLPKEKSIELNIKDFSKGLNLDDAENVCDLSYSISCYNFDFKSGALVEGLGFKDAILPISYKYGCDGRYPVKPLNTQYKNVWFFRHYAKGQRLRADRLVVRLNNGKCYYVRLFNTDAGLYYMETMEYNDEPFFTNVLYSNIEACFLSNGERSVMWTGESAPYLVENCPAIIDMCEHKDKMFLILKGPQNYIRYTNNKDVTEWTEELGENEGVVLLNDDRGLASRVISCFGHLYCIRDYGITKITTYENSDQMNISHIYSSGSKIFGKTVCNCGDKVIMLTSSGLYKFNGSNCEKIHTKLNDLLCKVASEHTIATYRAGVYYIASKIDFEDGKKVGCENLDSYVNNVLIAFNIIDNSYIITRGIDIYSISTIQYANLDKTFFCYNNTYCENLGEIEYSGKFFDDSTEKYWCSPLSDLGYSNKIKYVKEVSLLSKYDCKLTIFTECAEKSFDIKGKELLTKIPVKIKGKQIGIKIETNSQKAYISNMKLKINLIENKYA